ncbi:hypothetical protein GN244_ATG12702 [Phytophthora infestans]|uniref:Uncharacterized protein n=1 Tax=Phytophthora infestans TaxID=4787 RepID=A0A833S7B9_PHYIN|nr:hypothetical protein GN244_ATG19218 [Phytophthora infestans]KAF4035296.1 hypothetical protein GN244_ATG12702 [Phytophthora infestans]KAF4139218.1 hypothetical protein GN958_ATG11578 [Phytophthora infestans]
MVSPIVRFDSNVVIKMMARGGEAACVHSGLVAHLLKSLTADCFLLASSTSALCAGTVAHSPASTVSGYSE